MTSTSRSTRATAASPAAPATSATAPVCFTAQGSVEPGSVVQVHLRLVLEWGASEALVLPGQVAWLTASEGAHQIGVVFTVTAPDVRQRLQVLLKVLLRQISLPSPAA